MSQIREFGFLIAVALLASAASAHTARGDLITTLEVSTKAVAGGLTEFDYTLSDLSASTVTASSFFVAADFTANLTALSGAGVGTFRMPLATCAVAFTSPDPSVDILPGSSGVFSFESPLPPILAPFEVAGIDSNGNFDVNDGSIFEAASVPEPASGTRAC